MAILITMHYDCLLRSSNHDSQGKGWRSIIELSLSPVHCISWTSHFSFCIFLAMTLLQIVPLKKIWLAHFLVTFFKLGVKEVRASLPTPHKQVHDLTTVNGFLSLGTLIPWVNHAKATVNLCCLQPGTLNFYLNSSRKTINKLAFKHTFKKII